MSSGETQPEQLLDQTIRHCRKLFIAKKERLELEELCTTIGGQLRDGSLAQNQLDYDDLKSKLIGVEGQLAVWSNFDFLTELINRKTIKEGIRVFIGDLGSIFPQATRSPVASSTPGVNTPGSGGVEGTQWSNTGPVTSYHKPNGTPEKHPVGAEQPPSVKLLDGAVTREGEIPFAEGRSCQVWTGHWNNRGGENGNGKEIGKEGAGTKKVALKALKPRQPQGRAGKVERAKETERAERARKELMNEILRWTELHHPNILPFYGIVTDIETRVYMVFPWRENGNLLTYVKDHPQVDKYHLLRGSAAGLSYLHQKKYVHGNVRCNNVFITNKGEPQICDFGMARVFHETREKNTVSETKSSATDVRYAAPELIAHNDFRATTHSDTYSFALLILECITQVRPFFNLRREADIIHERLNKQNRPTLPGGEYHLPDDLWRLMGLCWSFLPEPRPTMEVVHLFFCRIEQAAGKV